MDESDKMVSNEQKSTMNQTAEKPKPTRTPKCTRCKNHHKSVQVKWHKRECPYRWCLCTKCVETIKRQQVMKEQTAQKRAQQQQETKMLQMRLNEANSDSAYSSAPPSVNGSIKSTSGNTFSAPVISRPKRTNPVPLSPPPTTLLNTPLSKADIEHFEVLLEYSAGLLQRFGYPWESLSLMYVILKDTRNIEVAIRRITEANSEIQAITQYKVSRLGVPGYYHPGCAESTESLGNPTYFGPVPYIGTASPPTTAGLGHFPYALGTHLTVKLPSSPDSPPERPASYPDDPSMSYQFMVEKSENSD